MEKYEFEGQGIISIEEGGTGGSTRKEALINLDSFRVFDSIENYLLGAEDIVSNWRNVVPSGVLWLNPNANIKSHESAYGILLNFNNNKKEYAQFFLPISSKAMPKFRNAGSGSEEWNDWAELLGTYEKSLDRSSGYIVFANDLILAWCSYTTKEGVSVVTKPYPFTTLRCMATEDVTGTNMGGVLHGWQRDATTATTDTIINENTYTHQISVFWIGKVA